MTNQTYAQPLENLLLFFLHLHQEQEMAELAALSIFQLSAGRATLFQEGFFPLAKPDALRPVKALKLLTDCKVTFFRLQTLRLTHVN